VPQAADRCSDGADRDRLRESGLDPGLGIRAGPLNGYRGGGVVVGEDGGVDGPTAAGEDRLGKGYLGCRCLVGYDGAVGVELRLLDGRICDGRVLELPGNCGWVCEDAGEGLSALKDRLAPDVLLHRFGSGDPWSSTLAPAGRARDGFFHPELIGQRRGVLEGVLPLSRHVGDAMVDDLRRGERGVEILEPGDADAVHPFEVELDSLFADVAIHPVPPDQWAGALRWVNEAIQQRVGGLRRGNLGRGADTDTEQHESKGFLSRHGDALQSISNTNKFQSMNPLWLRAASLWKPYPCSPSTRSS
jgi:hypothetical protein